MSSHEDDEHVSTKLLEKCFSAFTATDFTSMFTSFIIYLLYAVAHMSDMKRFNPQEQNI